MKGQSKLTATNGKNQATLSFNDVRNDKDFYDDDSDNDEYQRLNASSNKPPSSTTKKIASAGSGTCALISRRYYRQVLSLFAVFVVAMLYMQDWQTFWKGSNSPLSPASDVAKNTTLSVQQQRTGGSESIYDSSQNWTVADAISSTNADNSQATDQLDPTTENNEDVSKSAANEDTNKAVTEQGVDESIASSIADSNGEAPSPEAATDETATTNDAVIPVDITPSQNGLSDTSGTVLSSPNNTSDQASISNKDEDASENQDAAPIDITASKVGESSQSTEVEPTMSGEKFTIVSDKPGYKIPSSYLSETYIPRGKPIDAAEKQALAEKWGSWVFVDSKANDRSVLDNNFYSSYEQRDVPLTDFPPKAWQTDKEYLGEYLNEAKQLVSRSMEAILAEYGLGKFNKPDQNFEERSKLFSVSVLDFDKGEKLTKGSQNAGWMTTRCMKGLVRRMLHAIMTEDSFIFVMGGHSAAAGHGNHFQQSYTLQVQKILEPVFARLGVKFEARNFAMGGLGTLQSGIASGDFYGRDIDILLWDSGMTEKDADITDLFHRQAILAGDRIPAVWGTAHTSWLHSQVDADVGDINLSRSLGSSPGIEQTSSPVQVKELPWATQYLFCNNDMKGECNNHKFRSECWLPRNDVAPKTKQASKTEGRASWHPGDKAHQFSGRGIAFVILEALSQTIDTWMAADNMLLQDSQWHVSAYYANTRNKMKALPKSVGSCYAGNWPETFCRVAMNGRTEFTPRHNPHLTSLQSIVKKGVNFGTAAANVYDPPDVYNPNLNVPDGVFDALSVIENGLDFAPNLARKRQIEELTRVRQKPANLETIDAKEVIPGQGWTIDTKGSICDGTYDSFCNRDAAQICLLYAHNDNRGGIQFDSYSGWMVLNLEKLKHGTITLKIEDWHPAKSNARTNGWSCENNTCNGRNVRRRLKYPSSSSLATLAQNMSRNLKTPPPGYCEDFLFDVVIDGKLKTYNRAEWLGLHTNPQRVVQMWTILNDPDYTNGEAKDVEVAFRMTGCGRDKVMRFTHIYWA